MPHTNYDYISIAPYREGQIASAYPTAKRTGLNNTGALIPFGRVVVADTDEGDVKLPDATGQLLLGITFIEQLYEQDGTATDSGFPDKRQLDYLTKGDIGVYVEEAVAITDGVYFRHTANGAGKDVIGRFRTDSDTATCDQIVNARWVKGAGAGEIAVLNIDL